VHPLIPAIHVLNSPWHEGFRTISTEFSPIVTLLMVELVIPNLAWPMASFDENEEGLIQQSELADLRLPFPVSEETAPADDLGNLRRDHLVPGFVPTGDAFEDVP
jgi:hypothetical protein